ncbi:MAG: ABC transporter permease subunit [Desulfobacterales bacterium]|nr:ABC transporter permease subunit [Desulfobacterales bacterium]MDJ0875392.1 ABC transporter permease subunit [Desulfobacterales bacterium]MDJ0882979.1 ABC transporter permease subunit [Desulfobacterales bacterium]
MSRPKAVLVALTVLAAVGLPFATLVIWSLADRWFFPGLWPQAWGLRAWSYVVTTAGGQVITALWQSVAVAFVTAVVAVLVALPAARALGLYSFRGKDAISVLLTLPIIVPPLSVAMGLHLWFIRLDLAESFIGVVAVHLTFCLPYAVFVLWGVFSNYNPDFESQARSLGASRWRVWLRVMLPMILPGVIVAGLFAFLLSWSQYLSTLIIGGGRLITLPVLLFSLMGSGDRPVAAAVSIVFVLPALVALLFSARHLGGKSLAGVR